MYNDYAYVPCIVTGNFIMETGMLTYPSTLNTAGLTEIYGSFIAQCTELEELPIFEDLVKIGSNGASMYHKITDCTGSHTQKLRQLRNHTATNTYE